MYSDPKIGENPWVIILHLVYPLPSDRQHLSYDVCLEVRGEIIRTVLCCIVYWSCAVISTLRWAVLTVLWIGFCHTGPISLCVDLFVYLCVFCFILLLHSCCVIVSTVEWTWWDWSLILRTYLPSVLWHCWLGHSTRRNPSPMTYNLFGGTLDLALSIYLSVTSTFGSSWQVVGCCWSLWLSALWRLCIIYTCFTRLLETFVWLSLQHMATIFAFRCGVWIVFLTYLLRHAIVNNLWIALSLPCLQLCLSSERF